MAVTLPAHGDANWDSPLNTAINGIDSRLTTVEGKVITASAITSNLVPATTNTYTLGSTALRFSNVYVGTSVIYPDGSIQTSAPTTQGVPVTYSPVWSGTGLTYTGTPATGSYVQIGKYVFFTIKVVFTTVSNFGTGQYSLTLPFAPSGDYIFRNGGAHQGAVHYNIAADAAAGTTSMGLYHMQANNGGNTYVYDDILFQGNPTTFTTAGYMYVSGQYLVP